MARDSDSEEKRVRQKGAGANLEYSVDVVCGDHENGAVPRSLRRDYGLQSRVRETRIESERRCILTCDGSMIEMRVTGMTTVETMIGVLW